MIKHFVRKIVPEPVIKVYHWVLSYLAAAMYQNPSQELVVIGVTGTHGKTTTVEWIGRILESAGESVGWATTNSFKVGSKEWPNATKMTMLGRFKLQKMLRDMVTQGIKYAVIETSSQGIVQYRHLGIKYDVILITDLAPEHIEAHGGFENYKHAKGKLFEHLQGRGTKILNLDDKYVDYFAAFDSEKTYGFSVRSDDRKVVVQDKLTLVTPVVAENVKTTAKGSTFTISGQDFKLAPLGMFNVYNALAAITVAQALGFSLKEIAAGVSKLEGVPGRLEVIGEGQDFTVIVDYAFEPVALSKLFEAIELFDHNRVIHVTGSTGGGRDVARRPKIGKLSAEHADVTIVTNEDPYDDDPQEIID
ncbi:MAG: UDP-N-acetylmuramyl-tripeptide synthetase, partial [Candidatus Uhrbacteria bacterium]